MKVMILGGDGFCGWPTSVHRSALGHDAISIDSYAAVTLTGASTGRINHHFAEPRSHLRRALHPSKVSFISGKLVPAFSPSNHPLGSRGTHSPLTRGLDPSVVIPRSIEIKPTSHSNGRYDIAGSSSTDEDAERLDYGRAHLIVFHRIICARMVKAYASSIDTGNFSTRVTVSLSRSRLPMRRFCSAYLLSWVSRGPGVLRARFFSFCTRLLALWSGGRS